MNWKNKHFWCILNNVKMCKKAFTLVELVMVIAILAILAVVAVPRITSYSTLKLMGAASKLASDIRYAQQLAISKQIKCGLFFDLSSDSYFAYENTTTIKAIDPYTRRDLLIDYNNNKDYKGVDLFSSNFGVENILEFDQWGKPYKKKGSKKILLASDGMIILRYLSESKTIVISSNTGNVTIQ